MGIPTETVYGLGANALDGTAVKRIFEAKGRPRTIPHHPCDRRPVAARYCADVPPLAYVLAGNSGPAPDHDPEAAAHHPGRDHRRAGHGGGALPQPPGDAGDHPGGGHPHRGPQRQPLRPAQLHDCPGRAGGYGRPDQRRGGRRSPVRWVWSPRFWT